jgi:N-methylhydantoinase A
VRSLRVGIDVGGTFTDLVAVESWSGRTITHKLASTPREPQRAVCDGLASLLAQYDSTPAIELLAHSTTIATNALLGQIGLELPRAALVTTAGFRDVIEIGRQNRSEIYNLFVRRPRPLVAREDRLTVRERIDYCGQILLELDESEVRRVCAELRARDVAAVAVCLLHSYANDVHERLLAQAIAAALPAARVMYSAQIDPQYREYERFSTTVVNAVLAPIVEAYLERLAEDLRHRGVSTTLLLMRSDGGMATAQRIRSLPAAIIESGPAGGVIATAALGKRIGAARLLSFDMGGTTAKAGAVVDGVVQVAGEFEAAGATHSGRAVKGSGYPVRFPFVDLAEVSAGGGTIAWRDAFGVLHVGPLSAGADPGPACYGRSDRATVTDANVVLGRLNPGALLGGAFPIDAGRARAAIESVAEPAGLHVEAMALGIVALVDHAMAKVLRIVTVERGIDPRDFTLVAFGGGGPLHACALAEELGIARVVVPAHPGLFSATGLLDAVLVETELHPLLQTTAQMDHRAAERWFAQSESRAAQALAEQGARAESIAFRRQYDARYQGQSFELTIDHDASPEAIARRFHDAHRTRYGYDVRGESVELVNAKLTGVGSLPFAREFDAGPQARSGDRDGAVARKIYVAGGFVDVPVLQRPLLEDGRRVDGPAIVEEYDSTTYVPPGWSLAIDGEMLRLERQLA